MATVIYCHQDGFGVWLYWSPFGEGWSVKDDESAVGGEILVKGMYGHEGLLQGS